jgi:predicted HD superfamily hydrolase involved in NAD metabolism
VVLSDRADEFTARLRERLPEETVEHSISVAEMMVSMADRVGFTREQAVTAGLLHDLCKEMKRRELLEAANRYGIPVNSFQRVRPALLHGPVAAEEVRRDLGVNDEDVYDAIYWHTTGHPHFGKVGLALCFADFAEPLRSRPEAGEARRLLASNGFYPALGFVLQRKAEYLRTRPVVDPTTEAFYKWFFAEVLREPHSP